MAYRKAIRARDNWGKETGISSISNQGGLQGTYKNNCPPEVSIKYHPANCHCEKTNKQKGRMETALSDTTTNDPRVAMIARLSQERATLRS